MWNRIRVWFRRADRLSEELEHHLEALKEERLALGDTEAEAERFARMKLGNRSAIEETVQEISPLHFLDAGARQVRLAARTVWRHKRAYLSAAWVLALGIGVSVAMFSLVDAVLLRPLPFPKQESIEVIWKVDPLAGKYVEELAYPELRDLQERIRDFQYVAVMPTSLYGYARVLQTGTKEPVQIESTPVSHDFFRVLGVSPGLGRNFSSSDEHVGAAPVVILSDRTWRAHLGADPGVVGRTIRLNGQGYTVIGVMAPGVEFPRGAGMWFPLGVEKNVIERRGATFLQAIGRVKPHVSHDRIANQVDTLVRSLAQEHPEAYSPTQRAVVTPVVEYWTGSSRNHLWILLGASLLLLAAAIISASNLILSNILSRWTEIATRLALGTRRGQILAQLGTEGSVVAIVATVAGLGFAHLAIRFLVRWAPADIPRLSMAHLNLNSFCFAVGVAALATIACTLISGWSATRVNLESVLRAGGTRSSASRSGLRTRNVFLLAQAAVTVVLLAMAGLFVLSYRSMISPEIGFANRDALSMNLVLRGSGLFASGDISAESRRSFYTLLLNRLREAPGVISAAGVLVRPLEGPIGWERRYEFEFETGSKDDRVLPKANYEVITPEYFRTVGTPVVEGRDFDGHDSEKGELVAIISRALARLHFGSSSSDEWFKVVGVCGDARYRNVTEKSTDIFVPYLQAAPGTNYIVIRGRQSPSELAALVRRTLAGIDPDQAVAGVATIGELIAANTARHRFNMILLLWFGVCAAILAATGIYSVIAESIAARRQEIAIRIALGAPRARLVRNLISRTLGFVLLGEVLGAFAVTWLGTMASELLYGVAPADPVVLASVTAFVFGASLCAGFWPAWCAVDGNPNTSLHTS
jgi:predicted permease